MGVTQEILNYYQDVLETDFYLQYFFKKDNFIESNSNTDLNKKPFLFYGLSNSENAGIKFEKTFEELIKDKSKGGKKELELDTVFSLYYSPLMLEYKVEEYSEVFYFSPFFIELEVRDINKPFDSVERLKNFFLSNEKDDELFKENVFNGNKIILNPALLIEPFELLDTSFYERIEQKRKDNSKSFCISSHEDLYKFIIDYIETLKGNRYKLSEMKTSSDDKAKVGNKYILKNLRDIFNQEIIKYINELGVAKDISVRNDGFLFAKNNTIQHSDASMIKGLLNVYDAIKENGLLDDNLLNIVFNGNKHKYSPVPYSDIINDKTTINMTPRLNNDLTTKHLGALSSEYDLTTSQKYCLNLTNTDLPIIPVNGPPGTGKTSLLRAIVGDITVKNALSYYEQFLEKKDVFDFKTPIVSFSTNNRALDNIIEGIIEAYDEIYESYKNDNREDLAKRWINPVFNFVYFENEEKQEPINGRINDIKLYIPKIKNSQEYSNINPKYPIFGSKIANFGSIISDVKQNPKMFIFDFLKEFNKCFDLFDDIEISKERLEFFLCESINHLAQLIKENNELLEEKNREVKEWFNLKRDITKEVDKLSDQLNIEFGDIINKKDFDLFVKIIDKNFYYIYGLINKYKNSKQKIEDDYYLNKKKLTDNDLEIKSNIERKKNEEVFINLNDFKTTLILIEKDKNKQLDDNSILRNTRIKNIEAFHKNENFLKRIFSKIFGNHKDKLREVEKDFNLTEKNIISKYEIIYGEKEESFSLKVATTENKYKVELEKELEYIEEEISVNLKDYKHNLIELFDRSKEKLKSFKIEFNSFEELEIKFHELIRELEFIKNENKFFYDEYEKKIESVYLNADKKIRTLSFWYSQHLQEAIFLYEIYRLSRNKNITRKCFNPKCKKKNTVTCKPSKNNSNNDVYSCSECDFMFVNSEKTFYQKRKLFNYEIIELFELGYFNTDNSSHTIIPQEKINFWKVDTYGNNKSDKTFNYLSVFFPIVNTTCHSFGNVMPIEEKSIDYLFIDEAGMVLAPYIVNLYAGKKVFIFGDEKQIEPIYPLNLSTSKRKTIKNKKDISSDDSNPIEFRNKQEEINGYLIRKNISEGSDISKIYEFQSVLNCSIMSLSNRSIFINNKYIKRNEIGDLWLTEHFRCREDIIKYCNEHIYDNMMTIKTPNEEGKSHIEILDHDYNQSSLGTSKINQEEANIIINNILNLINNFGHDEKKIGVISPYREQAIIISKRAKENGLHNLVAGTVHAFQGSERDVIYISTTIGKEDNASSAFFNKPESPNIINVAVSRAKNKLIVVGNKAKLSENPNSLTAKLVRHIDFANKRIDSSENIS